MKVPGLTIRQYGDPVLKEITREVLDIDGAVAALADSMIETMYEAPGTGLAANQVGVQRRIFVYDVGEGARVRSSTRASSRVTVSGPTRRAVCRFRA